MHYSHIAASLGVGERTVKRYLAGHGLTLDALERMCMLVETRISELAAELEEQEPRPGRLTAGQEEALSRNLFAAFAFRLLRHGWTARDLQSEFDLDNAELAECLGFLEHLDLIELLPEKLVLLRTKRIIEWSPGGPIRRVFDTAVKQGFVDMDYGDPEAHWELKTLKLSAAGLEELKAMIREFSKEVRALGAKAALSPNATAWYSVLAAVRRVDPSLLRSEAPAL